MTAKIEKLQKKQWHLLVKSDVDVDNAVKHILETSEKKVSCFANSMLHCSEKLNLRPKAATVLHIRAKTYYPSLCLKI